MQIQRGKLYENRTWKYLYPCLKAYGKDLMKGLNSFFKLAVGVRDFNRDDNFNCIYILIDSNLPFNSDSQIKDYKNNLAKFLDWVKYQKYYVSDYIYEKDMHMLVLRLPAEHVGAYTNFIQGKYSLMYNLKNIRDYFAFVQIPDKSLELKQNDKIRNVRSIFDKDKSYIKDFVSIVNSEFKTNATTDDFQDAELDFPPKKEEEIFNFKDV